jgi:hypothetical protein
MLLLRQDFLGVFMNLNVESKEVKTLIENKNIAAITLTGSDLLGVPPHAGQT